MQIENYLKKHQPVIYKTFVRSLENDRLSHAYLISGNPGTPVFEVAKFLAKTILCDDPSPLACDNCITCLRVDDENYPDLKIFNGEKSMIKKGDIASIEQSFDKEALEAKGIRIYILHLIENMNEEATNSLLKFLEEPLPNIYAFLTTNNTNNVLPTIISRCQGFTLKSVSRDEVITGAINLGVEQEEAELLSFFYNDENLINEVIQNNNDDYQIYKKAKQNVINLLNLVCDDKREAIFYTQKDIIPQYKSAYELRLYIDILSQFLTDIINYSSDNEIVLKCQHDLLVKLASKIDRPSDVLIELLKMKSQINININPGLMLDHITLFLIGGK